MNKKQEDIVCFVTVGIVVVSAVMGGYFGMREVNEKGKLCADKFDAVTYSNWGGFKTDLENFGYEEIDETHYNCCWDEVELSDDGYYTKRKCKGFVRNN